MQTIPRTSRMLYKRPAIPTPHRLQPVLSFLLLSTLLLGYPYAASAQYDWTTVGSVGSVDEADQGKVVNNGSIVALKPEATGTVNLHYNVVSVGGLFGGSGIELGVRFRDNGPEARVVVRLRRYALVTGETTTLLTLNSNNFQPQEGFQLRTALDCSLRLDFFDYAYFLDVTLTKTGDAGTPALAVIQLASVRC